jgi:hypothetical protein
LYLHISGSTNPIGTTSNADRTAFHPYFSFKDLVTVYLFFILFTAIIFYTPDKLGLWMANLVQIYQDLYNTVCLNIVIILRTQVINVIISLLLLYLVKIVYISYIKKESWISRKLYSYWSYLKLKDNKIIENNGSLDIWFFKKSNIIYNKGSSETICVDTFTIFDKNIVNNNKDQFIYWLAGLIDGDGSLLINKNKALSCEITIQGRDVKALYEIKKRYSGSVLKRSNVKGYRWRVYKRAFVEKLYKDINGKLITDGKKVQLLKMGTFLNIKPVIIENYKFELDSAWLSGFIDANGFFSIRNFYTLTISIGQKTSGILYSIKEKLNCGNVYYDKRGNTYNYAVTDIKGIKIMLSYLDKYPLKTSKHIDSIKFRKLVEYKELKYHYKNNLNKPKIDRLIKLFKERYKI